MRKRKMKLIRTINSNSCNLVVRLAGDNNMVFLYADGAQA
jgi:hypothetical protein